MGYYDPDPFNQPEKFGLTIVHQVDDPDACYSFDMIVLWRHDETGSLYWAQDSGCSCPSPFEDFTSLDALELLTDDTWAKFEAAVNGWCASEWQGAKDEVQVCRTGLLAVAAKALRGK